MFRSNYGKEGIISYNIIIKSQEEKHFHQDIELIYILEGQMELKVENDIYNLKKDDIVIINTNKKHSYRGSKNILLVSFIISYQKLSSFLDSKLILFWCNSTIDKDNSFEEIRKVIKLIIYQFLKRKEKEDFYEYSLFYQLLNLLTKNFLINNAYENFHENKYDNRIEEIINYIRCNYNKPISLNDLADKLHLSNAYVSKYLKKNLGMNFIDYLNNIRLHHALEDLLYTDATITRAAFDNGFSSTALFNKLFKSTYNMTPSIYIKKIKNNKDDLYKESEPKEEILLDRLEKILLENKFDDKLNFVNNEQCIVVDTKENIEFKKNWNKVINVGAAIDLLQSDMQEHILILKNQLKFEYVRFWSIFAQNMYLGEYNIEGKYNFDKIDKILDFLIKNKIKPFIQFGQKLKGLVRTEKNHIIVEDESMAIKSISVWESITMAFSKHIVKRYGIEETETWCFEILWDDDMKLDIDYITIFNVVYKVIKSYIPNCKVGGAEFTGCYGVKQLMNDYINWKEFFMQSDFLSFSIFPYDIVVENESRYFKRSKDKNYLNNEVKKIKDILKQSKCDIKELYITEWNSTVSDRSFINDSCYKGAYIVKNIIDNIDEVDVLGYFIGSDLTSQFYDSDAFLNGGTGLISKNSIKKPAFYAIEFMNRLGRRIIKKGENYILTSDNDNEYFIVCHNYKHFNYNYYLKEEDKFKPREIETIFNDYNNLQLEFKFKELSKGQYNIKIYSISNQNGSVLDEWINMDEIRSLEKDEIDYLKRISTPKLTMKRYFVDEGTLDILVNLVPHECNLIQISYKD